MFKRQHYIALGVVLLLTVVVWQLPDRLATRFKLAVGTLFLPLFGLAGSTGDAAEKASQALVPRGELVRRLEQLERENQQLQLRAVQAEELARENERFRQHFGWQKQTPWNLKLARVIARDPANWWRTLRIDLGARDGVAANAPVLVPEGLVGRVAEVGYAHAQVVLIGDPDCRVGVMLAEPPYEQGIIAPASSNPLDSSLVDLGYLSRHAQLRPGQRVVTSGLGGLFPKGIPVGQVVDYRTVGYGLYSEARVKLTVKLNSLEEVWVKLP